MSERAVTVTSQGVRAPVATARLARVAEMVLRAEKVAHATISVTLVSNARMAAINLKHLKHKGPTDVISFGFQAVPGAPVTGDIYIAPAVARENAKRHGNGVREELVRLVTHGVLHVLGYDHPVDETRERSPMWRRQERLVARAMRDSAIGGSSTKARRTMGSSRKRRSVKS